MNNKDPTGWWISEKYDGIRGYWNGNTLISRQGKENTFFNATPFSKIPAGVLSVSDNPTIKVDAYPNPFHSETNIVVNSTMPLQNCKLEIFDISGKKEEELPIPANGSYKLNFNYPAGTYIWSLIENTRPIANGKWVIE